MIQVNIAKHAVAFPSKVLARDGGKHIYNIQLAEASGKFVDNGWFVPYSTTKLWQNIFMQNIQLGLKVIISLNSANQLIGTLMRN